MRVMDRLISAYLALCNRNEIAAMIAGLSAIVGSMLLISLIFSIEIYFLDWLGIYYEFLFYIISLPLLLPAAYVLFLLGYLAIECMWAIFGVYRVLGIQGRPHRDRVARYLEKREGRRAALSRPAGGEGNQFRKRIK